jgi:hypothetical protein
MAGQPAQSIPARDGPRKRSGRDVVDVPVAPCFAGATRRGEQHKPVRDQRESSLFIFRRGLRRESDRRSTVRVHEYGEGAR